MNRLLTPQELADLLGVKLSTVYQWTHQGYVPHVKLGRLIRFREARVMEWVEKRSTKGRTQRRPDLGELGL